MNVCIYAQNDDIHIYIHTYIHTLCIHIRAVECITASQALCIIYIYIYIYIYILYYTCTLIKYAHTSSKYWHIYPLLTLVRLSIPPSSASHVCIYVKSIHCHLGWRTVILKCHKNNELCLTKTYLGSFFSRVL